MHILVIGGAGYIGSHVVRTLLDREFRVTVYDNLSSGLRENLFPEAQFIEGDILDKPSLDRAMSQDVEAIIHLSALKAAGESMYFPEKYANNNLTGTLNILNSASEQKVRTFVFSSSAAVYGEPVYLPIDEKHPTQPENFYGFTKLEVERILAWYSKLKGIRFAALRYFNAAGYDVKGRCKGLEKNPANLLPVIMETACGMRSSMKIFGNDFDTRDGYGIRDYVHVNDLADAHLLALEYIRKNDQDLTVNLGSETGISVMEMLTAARRITGQPIPAEVSGRRSGDPSKVTASSENAKKILGWQARHSDVDTLIRSTWEIYKRFLK